MEEADRLRHTEPDQFHALVKMHLSFMLDLNTDECDCGAVSAAVVDSNEAGAHTNSVAKKLMLLTPRKFLGSSSGASSTSTESFRTAKNLMDCLTQEGVCRVFQLVNFLSREQNIVVEGLFRKHGNIRKQQALKEILCKGVAFDPDLGEFSVHEVASVLKSFLSDMSEPLLTDAYYMAHCQVAQLVKASMSDEEKAAATEKKIQCLQLLFLLIPETNYNLLKDLLFLLNKVSRHEDRNKMSSGNLGTHFSPIILCPRKLSAEALQSNHQMLANAVAFMVEKCESLFSVPPQLAKDIEVYTAERLRLSTTTPIRTPTVRRTTTGTGGAKIDSPVVRTIFSFVDRQMSTKLADAESSTDTALAALYAHVQAMPESAQKKQLVKRLNEANGQGTPSVRRQPGGGGASAAGNSSKIIGEGIKSFLTPKRQRGVPAGKDSEKMGRYGSYDLRQRKDQFKTPQVVHTFRKQASSATPMTNQKLLSPQQSSPAVLVSPANGFEVVTADNLDGSYIGQQTPRLDSFRARVPPPVPVRMSSLEAASSPITSSAQKMPADMQRSMMTPGSRKPVLALHSNTDLSLNVACLTKGVFAVPRGKEGLCQPSMYNEDEPDVQDEEKLANLDADVEDHEYEEEEEEDAPAEDQCSSCTDSETDSYFASLEQGEGPRNLEGAFEDESSPNESRCCDRDVSEVVIRTREYTSRSLGKAFREYLEEQGLEDAGESTINDASVTSSSAAPNEAHDASVTSSVLNEEANQLLTGDLSLSESMRAILNGEDPELRTPAKTEDSTIAKSNLAVTEPITPSMLEPLDVDSALGDFDTVYEEEDETDENDSVSYVSARSTYASSSSLPGVKIGSITVKSPPSSSSSDETSSVLSRGGTRSSRKRRSLTEIADLNPVVLQQRKTAAMGQGGAAVNSVFFETDL